jgi:hypothetical protein
MDTAAAIAGADKAASEASAAGAASLVTGLIALLRLGVVLLKSCLSLAFCTGRTCPIPVSVG